MPQLLIVFLNVLAPVFTLVGIGYVSSKTLKLDARTLSRFAYFVLTPAFVFGYMSNAQVTIGLAARMIGFISAVYLASTFVAFAAAKLLRRDAKTTAAFVMMAVFGNVGNYGLPISKFAQGDGAIVPSAIYFLANLVLAFVVCVFVASTGRSRLRAALNVIKTPALIALVPAILFNALDVRWPLFVTRPIELLSGALIPTMLITLGAQMAAVGIPKPNTDMLVAIGIRLICGPLLAFALVDAFGLTGLERNVGLIQSSMPTAVLVSLIGLEYNVKSEFLTAAVLLSNVLSIVTLTLVLSLL